MVPVRSGRGSALLLAGLCLAVAVAGVLLVANSGRFVVVSDRLTDADAVVVLGGECTGFQRARHGVELYRAGYAPSVVFSGGTLLNAGLACSSAALSIESAMGLGLPAEAILIAPEAQSTYDEARNLSRLAAERGWTSLIVVTSPVHSRRAARTLRTVLPGVRVMLAPAPDPTYDPARWWANEGSLVAVFDEYLKLGFYWLNHSVTPWEL